jgi:SAM-dependent methyltransferase
MSAIKILGATAPSAIGRLIDATTLAADIDEPLGESARLCFELAQQYCSSPETGCRSYHALWQYLRLAGVARGLQTDGPLYVDAAERLARGAQLSRILISGTADYSMLAYLAHGARRGDGEPQFDVLDRCETTLAINRWYADRTGLRLRTMKFDATAFLPDCAYDLICTHSILPWFSAEERPRQFQRWRDWLAPGGRLCFSNRISPQGVPHDADALRARQVEIRAMVRATLDDLGLGLPCGEPEFDALFKHLGNHKPGGYPELPLDVIKGWIADAGLDLEHAVVVAEVLPGREDRVIYSGSHEGRPRIWFQARRTQ